MGTLALIYSRQGRDGEARELIGRAEEMVLASEPATGLVGIRVLAIKKEILAER